MIDASGGRGNVGSPGAAPSSSAAVVELAPDDPRWAAFAGVAPGATPFHQPAWQRALAAAYGYRAVVLAVTDGGGSVEAGLPLLRVARPGRASWVALPFTDHCPPLAASDAALSALARGVAGWQAGAGARLEVRGALPCGPGWSAAVVGVRHVLPLDGGAEAVERRLPRPVVRHVRSAQRSGLCVRVTSSAGDLWPFYRLHTATRRRLGAPVQPRRFMAALWRHVVEAGHGFAVLASRDDGVAIGAGLFLTGGGSVVMKFSASDPAAWHLKPNHLVTWAAIEWACAHGFAALDFGRSELHHATLRRYKASWGAEELPLVHTTRGGRGGAGLVGPSRLRSALGAVIRRSPPVVCRALGELLYPLAG